MRLLVTGHDGYIGAVMTPLLLAAGHEVVGLDSGWFEECGFGTGAALAPVPTLRLDLRDVEARDLEGFDAVLHLGGLSNDPLGDLDPRLTVRINEEASLRLARLAREAGVERFLFSSSCSSHNSGSS